MTNVIFEAVRRVNDRFEENGWKGSFSHAVTDEVKQSLAKSIKKVKKVDSKVDNPEFELGYRLACDLISGELGLEAKNG